MRYWKETATPRVEEIHRALYSKEAKGIYARDIEQYFNRRGFRTFAFKGTWDDLAEQVSKGRPLIVCLERNARGVPLHYVVVAGIDRDEDLAWINDPAQRKLLAMRRAEFESAWSATGNWVLLAVPEEVSVAPHASPPTAAIIDPSELELATTAFRAENFTETEHHLKSVLRGNPVDPFANDFLGTTYLLDGNFAAALKYWNRAGKPKVREIRIEPPLQIDPVLLDHAFAFSRASVLSSKDYRITRQKLDSLGIFGRYEFDLAPTDSEDFDLTFRASERNGSNFLSWLGGLPFQTVYPQLWNAGGRAINLESLVRWDNDKRRVFVLFSSPLRENPSLGYRFQFDMRNENWERADDMFNLRRSDLAAEIRGILSDRWSWTNGIAVTHRTFSNSFNGGSSLSYKASLHRTVLSIPEKRLTIESSARTQVGKLFMRPAERFLKVESDLTTRWFLLPRRDDYDSDVRLSVAKSFGRVPFDELYSLGLDRDSDRRLRGHPTTRFGRKGAGPIGPDYFLLNYDFSKMFYDNTFVRIKCGPFLDAGHISSQTSWLVDSGIQVKVSIFKALTLSLSVGRDLRNGRNTVFMDSGREGY